MDSSPFSNTITDVQNRQDKKQIVNSGLLRANTDSRRTTPVSGKGPAFGFAIRRQTIEFRECRSGVARICIRQVRPESAAPIPGRGEHAGRRGGRLFY